MAAAGTTVKKELTKAEQIDKAVRNLAKMGRELNALCKRYTENGKLRSFVARYEVWQEDFEEAQEMLDSLTTEVAETAKKAAA